MAVLESSAVNLAEPRPHVLQHEPQMTGLSVIARLQQLDTTIGSMALFTVILEFAGGTYISQFRASSPDDAAVKHADYLVGLKGMSTLSNRRRLADSLALEPPVAIEVVRKVWCCSASVRGGLALVNIVATA